MNELTIPDELPQMRISDTGKPLFNKGNTLWKRVRMTEELKSRKREILRDIRSKVPPESYSHIRSRSVVAIKDGKLCLRYCSITDATRKTGINCSVEVAVQVFGQEDYTGSTKMIIVG